MTRDDVDATLAALDRALSDSPDVVYEDLVKATRCLVGLRDTLTLEYRRGAVENDRLRRLNSVLSLVVAAEYPLEGVRRDRVAMARRELASLFS